MNVCVRVCVRVSVCFCVFLCVSVCFCVFLCVYIYIYTCLRKYYPALRKIAANSGQGPSLENLHNECFAL